MSRLLPLSTLPQDGKLYRVDLIGNINRNPHCSKNHLLNVFIRPMQQSIFSNANSLDAALNSEKLVSCSIPIGDIGNFPPLSILKDGQTRSKNSFPNIFLNINSEISATRFITADHRDDFWTNNHHLIPYSAFRLGIAAGTPITAIERDGDPFSLLIPTAEIIRYFYLSSSRFNQYLFSAESHDLSTLLNHEYTSIDLDRRSIKIRLRKDVPDCDAGIIAELLTSKVARENATRLWGGLIMLKHNKNINHFAPRVGLPFDGPASLSGVGLELPTPSCFSNSRSLLLKITDCRYSLAFDEILLDRDNPGYNSKKPLNDDNTEGSDVGKSSPCATTKPGEGKNNPLTPSSPIPSNISFDNLENRYSSIAVKKVYQDTVGKSENRNRIRRFLKDQTTTPTQSSDSTSAKISVQPEAFKSEDDTNHKDQDKPPSDFAHIRKVVSILKENANISIATLKINSSYTDDLSQFPSGYNDWSGYIIGRSLYLAEIEYNEKYYYLMEVEPYNGRRYSTIVFRRPDFTSIDSWTHYRLLDFLSSSSFIKYAETFDIFKYRMKSFRHCKAWSQAEKIDAYLA